jgi:hypothetical protein
MPSVILVARTGGGSRCDACRTVDSCQWHAGMSAPLVMHRIGANLETTKTGFIWALSLRAIFVTKHGCYISTRGDVLTLCHFAALDRFREHRGFFDASFVNLCVQCLGEACSPKLPPYSAPVSSLLWRSRNGRALGRGNCHLHRHVKPSESSRPCFPSFAKTSGCAGIRRARSNECGVP